MSFLISLLLILSPQHSFPANQSPSEFNAPWISTETSIVIDAYERNSINWESMATDPRVVAVIHRCSIGLKRDTAYSERKKIAQQNGYLWGAYHLGKAGDPYKAYNNFDLKLDQ